MITGFSKLSARSDGLLRWNIWFFTGWSTWIKIVRMFPLHVFPMTYLGEVVYEVRRGITRNCLCSISLNSLIKSHTSSLTSESMKWSVLLDSGIGIIILVTKFCQLCKRDRISFLHKCNENCIIGLVYFVYDHKMIKALV